ncbi:MAG TPA: fibronectin type III domain-containing protein [Nocardioides sp.]|nr:fibronectin type III domain-containing protein [Nocardioides sp.]HVX53415.1 fibronectin type III domain-containing protein [Nocardioides sp.]
MRMWQFVRRGVLVGALVVAGLVGVEVAPASAAPTAPPAATFIQCTDKGSTSAVYVLVGGAALHVQSWTNFGYDISGGPSHPTPTKRSCKSLPVVPADGTFIRGVKAVKNSAGTVTNWAWTGSTYEVIGGTPITVHAWSHVGLSAAPSGSPKAVDSTVLSALVAPGAACPSSYAGCLYSRPRNGAVFSGYNTTAHKATTFYKVDSLGHPVPQAAATSGEKTVDQTSINACERMDCAPNGQIVNSGGTGYGILHVDGWAMDYPSAAPVSVQLTAGGSTFVVPANQQTNEVLPSVAGNHGFSVNLPIPAGSYVLCATVLGTTPGATTQDLGCSNVSVPGAKPGKVHRPKVKVKGHGKVRVKWKTPAQNGSPVNLYVVKVSVGSKHKKKQVAGAKHKVVLKHLPRGQQVQVKVKANNLYGFGPASKKSKPVRVR